MGGNYQNNLFLESTTNSIIFNTGGNNSTSTSRMIINSSGNVGIGTTNPQYSLHVNGTSYMSSNVGIGTTPSSANALTVNGASDLINNPTNPGNTTSASFWNQAGVGPTISGLNLSVQMNGTTEAMRLPMVI